ncbi:hypothetical protein MAPG_02419 [Magnaporthiopsis poae ATCC 64411]|uniref:Fucose-specific lectin n=1 Tax=Magnaporthiopsis poae (strain ATCC 64411 / 73-15) TaxID=644358 RepID=A0A0C4DRB1_MAGP6|nr:hypothetical protein MAPG_02419 [Magnaporthiopsis poae ATCC 64411]
MIPLAGRPSGALPSSILLLSLAVQSCSASMAAWLTTLGPQVIRQNETTGAIMYSFCNSTGTPVFPVDNPNTLSLAFEPRNGTAITGKGWWDNQKTVASIFYQSKDGDIINTYQECNMKTGKLNKINDRIISDDKPAVHNTTGLTSVLLNAKEGYRIYYHDTNKTIQVIGYDPDANTFYYGGVVSRDTTSGFALGAQFNSVRNISVVYPRDSDNMGVARINSDGKYWLATTPRPLALGTNVTANTNLTNMANITLDAQASTNFSLASWTGNPKSMDIAVDKSSTRSIFYIGSDRALHQVGNINWVWRLMNTNLSTSVWPLADEPNAEFALASDQASSAVRIYYTVNKTLTEIKFDTDGLWKPAMALPVVSPNASTPLPDPNGKPADPNPGPASGASDQPSGGGSGLSLGAKAGIGAGVAVGVLAIMGVVLVVLIMRHKKKKQAEAEAEAMAQAEDEKRQQEAALAAQQQQQQYYYSYGNAGSPPPQTTTPFSDGTASVWAGYDKKSLGGAGSPPPPPPQELHAVASTHELADPRYTTHELPEQRPTLEMDGHGAAAAGPESQALMHHGPPKSTYLPGAFRETASIW